MYNSSTLYQAFDAWKSQMTKVVATRDLNSFVFVLNALVIRPSNELVDVYMHTQSFIQVLDSAKPMVHVAKQKKTSGGIRKKRIRHRDAHSPTSPTNTNKNRQCVTSTNASILQNTVQRSRFGRKLEKSTRFHVPLW